MDLDSGKAVRMHYSGRLGPQRQFYQPADIVLDGTLDQRKKVVLSLGQTNLAVSTRVPRHQL
jgi:hypothetical protein